MGYISDINGLNEVFENLNGVILTTAMRVYEDDVRVKSAVGVRKTDLQGVPVTHIVLNNI